MVFSGAFAFLEAKRQTQPINTDFDLSIAPTIWAGVSCHDRLSHHRVWREPDDGSACPGRKTIGDAKKSYLFMGYVAFIIYFIFIFIGALLLCFLRSKPFDQTNAIILNFAASLAIPGLLGIIGTAILSASMSSTSSAFNSLATVTISDFYKLFIKSEASDRFITKASRIVTVMWAVVIVPIALAFVEVPALSLRQWHLFYLILCRRKICDVRDGIFSKHVNEPGLIIGVIAGFVAVYISAQGVPVLGIEDPNIAALYAVIGSVVNIAVAWIASITLEGFQTEWHRFWRSRPTNDVCGTEKPNTEDGWYLIPGRIESRSGAYWACSL